MVTIRKGRPLIRWFQYPSSVNIGVLASEMILVWGMLRGKSPIVNFIKALKKAIENYIREMEVVAGCISSRSHQFAIDNCWW